jgi:hypothetical protein
MAHRASTSVAAANPVCTRVFTACGLPTRLRPDNGVPFATHTLARRSPWSAWWVRLGIVPECIAPGKPQQNGRHERMPRTLTANPPDRPLPSCAHHNGSSIAAVRSSTSSDRTKRLPCKRLLPSMNPPHAPCCLNCRPYRSLRPVISCSSARVRASCTVSAHCCSRTINPSCKVHTCAKRAVNRLPLLLAPPA